MLEMLLLIVLVLPIAYSLVKAIVASKDYYDYDDKNCCYVSRVTK